MLDGYTPYSEESWMEAADIEFTRRQPDQLIEALRELVGRLNQFTELIRAGNFGGIRLI